MLKRLRKRQRKQLDYRCPIMACSEQERDSQQRYGYSERRLWSTVFGNSRRASNASTSQFVVAAIRLQQIYNIQIRLALPKMSSTADIASSFIEGAPPGELSDVVNDVKALTSDNEPALISKLKPAFQKYNEEQLTAVKLPGSSQPVSDAHRASWCCADLRRFLSANTTSSQMDDTTMRRATPALSSTTSHK